MCLRTELCWEEGFLEGMMLCMVEKGSDEGFESLRKEG